jgi:lipid-A-disaccharide synthase
MTKIYMIAGEPSGDFLGGQLIKALSAAKADLVIRGIGGDHMQTKGLDMLFHLDAIAVMGLFELIPHLWEIKRRIKRTINDICTFQPDVLVTIDAPGFCNRVIDGVKKRLPHLKVIHYVAPSVWAWRPGRAKTLAKRVEHLLCLFPFEPPYFEEHGLQTTFVGHPVVEMDWSLDKDIQKTLGLNPSLKTLCMLPGSRSGEIKRHAHVFASVIAKLENVQVIIPTFQRYVPLLSSLCPKAICVTEPYLKRQALIVSDAALAVSGTVSLELAMAETPMVIAYKASDMTYTILRHFVTVSSACLVNLLLGQSIVPECIQGNCTADILSKQLQLLFYGDTSRQREAFKHISKLLSPASLTPSEQAARVILEDLI